MKRIYISILLLFSFLLSFGQFKLEKTDWVIGNYGGSCYFDTIISAIWIQILPNDSTFYLNSDTSYLVAKAEVVNKSPIAIFVQGDSFRMKVPVLREWYEPDTSILRRESKFGITPQYSAIPRKLRTETTYDLYSTGKFPFGDLWQKDNDNYIEIKSGERKILYFPLPKYKASYRLEAIIGFNKERLSYDCNGEIVNWPQYQTIQSNKIDLYIGI